MQATSEPASCRTRSCSAPQTAWQAPILAGTRRTLAGCRGTAANGIGRAGNQQGETVSEYQLAALILAVIGPVLAIGGHFGAPVSLVLFALGLGSAFLPGLPPLAVDPD